MFQRDWLMRQILSLAQVIATTVFQLKQEKKYEEALQTLEELYGRLNLPKSGLLLNLSDGDLLEVMSVNGLLNLEKAISAALLLKEEAELYEALECEEEAYRRNVKSLFLFLAAEERDGQPPAYDCREAVDELYGRLKAYDIPAALLLRLAAHFENAGRYAKAEDIWFELAERGADCAAEGRGFFARLLGKTDEDLAAGGLPREEVLDGLRDWAAVDARREDQAFLVKRYKSRMGL